MVSLLAGAERIAGRWIHPASGRSYHTKFAPPAVAGKDDITGEPLIQRKDDNVDTLKSRLEGYHNQTTPVLDYYKKKSLLSTIDADQKMAKVWDGIKAALSK